MKLKKAVKILKRHNEWRREESNFVTGMQDPIVVGKAIDVVVEACQEMQEADDMSLWTDFKKFEKLLKKEGALQDYYQNLDHSLNSILNSEPDHWMLRSFIWDKAKEGFGYWENIHNKWLKKLSK